MSQAPGPTHTPPPAGGPLQQGPRWPDVPPTPDEKTMGMLCHLLGLFTGFLGPLIIWMIKKDESQYVNVHGKEALNFQLTCLIGYVASGVLSLVFIGFFTALAIWVVAIIFGIMGTMAANRGETYEYPINIRMIT